MTGRDGKIPLGFARRDFGLVTTSQVALRANLLRVILAPARLTRQEPLGSLQNSHFASRNRASCGWEERGTPLTGILVRGRTGQEKPLSAYRSLTGALRAAAARPRCGENQEKFFAQLSAKESWRGVERSSTALHSVSGIWFALPQSPKGDMSRLPLRSAMDGRHRRPSPPQRGGLPPSLREVSSRSDDGGSVILSRSYSYLSYRLFAPATAVGHGEGPAHT